MNLNNETLDLDAAHEGSPQDASNSGPSRGEGELIIADDHNSTELVQPPVDAANNAHVQPVQAHHHQMHNFQHNYMQQHHFQHHQQIIHQPNNLGQMHSHMSMINAQQMSMIHRHNMHMNQTAPPAMYGQQNVPVAHQGLMQQKLPPRRLSQATCELPSMEEFLGNFEFTINVTKALEESKRPTWEYSDILNKLFVMESRNVPIQFKVNKVDTRMYIRAVAVYCDPDSSNKPVLRCPNHSRPDETLNIGYRHPDHVIRCDNSHAVYETDPVSHRRSVLAPLGIPQPGSDFVTVLYSMMCRSSCLNGINRRSVALVFTLEIEGQVFGRRVLPIRVCASPHRDRKLEEDKAARNISDDAPSLTVKEEVGRSPTVAASTEESNDPLGPLDQMYFVPVNNCDDYVALARMAKDLVVRDYAEGPLKDAEVQRYQSILHTMGDNNV